MGFDHVRQHRAVTGFALRPTVSIDTDLCPRGRPTLVGGTDRPSSTPPPDLSRWRRGPFGPTVAATTMATATAPQRPMPRWQRSLLPAVLGADHADRGQPGGVHLPRSLRDWVVDLIMFAFALALGTAGAWQDAKHATTWWVIVDIVAGLVVCGALWVRRDHPFAVGTAA